MASLKKIILIAIFVLVTVLAVVALALAIAAFVKSKNNENDSGGTATTTPVQTTTKIGNTQGWKDAADILIKAMNTTKDPCDDFFFYACDNWNKDHPIPQGAQSYYVYDEMQYESYNLLNSSLRQISTTTEKSTALLASKYFYKACIDFNNNKDISFNGEVLAMVNSMGGWPIIAGDWIPTSTDVAKLTGTLYRKLMLTPLLASSVAVNQKNVVDHTLYLDQGNLGLDSISYYLNDTTEFNRNKTRDYKADIKKAVALLNNTAIADLPKSVDSAIEALYQFEKGIAGIMVPLSDRRNHSIQYNAMRWSDIKAAAPKTWNFESYITAVFDSTGVDKIKDDDMIVVVEPVYLQKLGHLLASTDYKTVVNYVMWRFVQSQTQFLKTKTLEETLPSVVTCANQLLSTLIYPSGRLLIEVSDFGDQERNQVSELTINVQNAFGQMLNELAWMDTPSKAAAKFKLQNLAQNIGWPTWIFDDDLLDAYHAKLNIAPDMNYFMMYHNVMDFFSWTSISEMRKSTNRHDFQLSPAYVNAWYEPTYNSITIPVGILLSPQYRKDFPMAFNYGSEGNTPGHEITHGFDDEGVQFDWNGTLHTWMDQKSTNGFKDMAQCVVKQYGEFCINILGDRYCVNGIHTQGENIADNGGIRASYLAYQQYIKSHGEEPRLPGLEDMTMEQIYFLSFAFSWCGTETDSLHIQRLLTNPHAPPHDRVVGTLRNFPEFGEAFNCKMGVDKMYPKTNDRCRVWWSGTD